MSVKALKGFKDIVPGEVETWQFIEKTARTIFHRFDFDEIKVPILEKTKSVSQILVIDGCPLDCAKLCLEKAGFADMKHLRVADLGFEKGKTGISDEAIDAVTSKAEDLLARKEVS